MEEEDDKTPEMKQKRGTYAQFLTLLIKLDNLKTIVPPILKIVCNNL